MNVSRTVRKATHADLETVWRLIEGGKRIMRESGNTRQWSVSRPSKEQIRSDIERGVSYLLADGGTAIGTWAFVPSPESTCSKIYHGRWIDDTKPYHVIHRVAGLSGYGGVMGDIFEWCSQHSCNIRIDAHRDNAVMRHCIERSGIKYCGIIHLDNGDERLAYQWLKH